MIRERKFYGLTFRGYADEYWLSTARSCEEAIPQIREFFARRNARIVSEQERSLTFARGRKLYSYLGGLDTWAAQEITASFDEDPQTTMILLRYKVAGWHLRTPPNQLRSEALRLERLLNAVSTEPYAAPNGGPATQPGNSGVTEGPPSVS